MLCPKVSLELVKAFRSLGTKEEEGNFLSKHILKHWFILGLCLYCIARNSSRGVFQVRIQPRDTHSSHSDCDFCSKSVQCGRTLVPSLIHIRFSSLALKAAQGTMMKLDQDIKNSPFFHLFACKAYKQIFFHLLLTFLECISHAMLHKTCTCKFDRQE